MHMDKKSRRNFLKSSTMLAATSVASAAPALLAADTGTPAPAPIRIAAAFTEALNTPVKPIAFPLRGGQVFAKVCKDEGLAALFCCPGNYDIINAIVEEGIPAYGGRTEGAMCAAADGFIRVTGETAACSGTEGPGFTNMIMNIADSTAGPRQQQEHLRRRCRDGHPDRLPAADHRGHAQVRQADDRSEARF
jgi:hypothetical protein